MVHADDVADVIVRVLDAQAQGAFNLAAPPAITAGDIALAVGSRLVHVPAAALRAAVSLTWHARRRAAADDPDPCPSVASEAP